MRECIWDHTAQALDEWLFMTNHLFWEQNKKIYTIQ